MKSNYKPPMRNLKELNAILTAIHCLNVLNNPRDPEIFKLTDYAFRRIFGCNSNLKSVYCIGRTREEMLEILMKLLEEDTQYLEYLKEYHTNDESK